MSNFRRLEYCTRCIQMTNHDWYDNTPKHHEYTVECAKCKLRTHESEWPRSSEQPASSELAQMPNQNSLEEILKDLQTSWMYQSVNLPEDKTVLDPPREKALAAINKTIMEDVLAIIGEDEPQHADYSTQVLLAVAERNNLRTELRQAVIKRYGGEDNE